MTYFCLLSINTESIVLITHVRHEVSVLCQFWLSSDIVIELSAYVAPARPTCAWLYTLYCIHQKRSRKRQQCSNCEFYWLKCWKYDTYADRQTHNAKRIENNKRRDYFKSLAKCTLNAHVFKCQIGRGFQTDKSLSKQQTQWKALGRCDDEVRQPQNDIEITRLAYTC